MVSVRQPQSNLALRRNQKASSNTSGKNVRKTVMQLLLRTRTLIPLPVLLLALRRLRFWATGKSVIQAKLLWIDPCQRFPHSNMISSLTLLDSVGSGAPGEVLYSLLWMAGTIACVT